jgi:hypothetical protein
MSVFQGQQRRSITAAGEGASIKQRAMPFENVRVEVLALPGALATLFSFLVTAYDAPCSHSGAARVIAALSVVMFPVMAFGTITSLFLTPLAFVRFVRAPRFNPIAIVLLLLSLVPFITLLAVCFD